MKSCCKSWMEIQSSQYLSILEDDFQLQLLQTNADQYTQNWEYYATHLRHNDWSSFQHWNQRERAHLDKQLRAHQQYNSFDSELQNRKESWFNCLNLTRSSLSKNELQKAVLKHGTCRLKTHCAQLVHCKIALLN